MRAVSLTPKVSPFQIFEFNVLHRTSTETADTGAFEFNGVAENFSTFATIGFDFNNTIKHSTCTSVPSLPRYR